jgi:hypothetical protein
VWNLYFFWIYSNQGIQYLFETTGITKWLESKEAITFSDYSRQNNYCGGLMVFILPLV